MIVRRLTTGDENLWRSAVAAVIDEKSRKARLVSASEVESALADPRCYLLVAMQGINPVALLTAYRFPDLVEGGQLVYLYDIEVLAHQRRNGMGTALIEELLNSCEGDDVRVVWAGTDRNNVAARRTFEQTGAELEGDSYVEYEWDFEARAFRVRSETAS